MMLHFYTLCNNNLLAATVLYLFAILIYIFIGGITLYLLACWEYNRRNRTLQELRRTKKLSAVNAKR